MSELFNPYAVSVLGSPLPQKAPPQLRAEGRPMTRPQLDMARFVFGRFLEQARLSYVPNPTQHGFLPDGSRFRIVDVAGSMTMQVWPVGPQVDDLPIQLDSGIIVSNVSESTFYRLFKKGGQWRWELSPSGYCGLSVIARKHDKGGIVHFVRNQGIFTEHHKPYEEQAYSRTYTVEYSPNGVEKERGDHPDGYVWKYKAFVVEAQFTKHTISNISGDLKNYAVMHCYISGESIHVYVDTARVVDGVVNKDSYTINNGRYDDEGNAVEPDFILDIGGSFTIEHTIAANDGVFQLVVGNYVLGEFLEYDTIYRLTRYFDERRADSLSHIENKNIHYIGRPRSLKVFNVSGKTVSQTAAKKTFNNKFKYKCKVYSSHEDITSQKEEYIHTSVISAGNSLEDVPEGFTELFGEYKSTDYWVSYNSVRDADYQESRESSAFISRHSYYDGNLYDLCADIECSEQLLRYTNDPIKRQATSKNRTRIKDEIEGTEYNGPEGDGTYIFNEGAYNGIYATATTTSHELEEPTGIKPASEILEVKTSLKGYYRIKKLDSVADAIDPEYLDEPNQKRICVYDSDILIKREIEDKSSGDGPSLEGSEIKFNIKHQVGFDTQTATICFLEFVGESIDVRMDIKSTPTVPYYNIRAAYVYEPSYSVTFRVSANFVVYKDGDRLYEKSLYTDREYSSTVVVREEALTSSSSLTCPDEGELKTFVAGTIYKDGHIRYGFFWGWGAFVYGGYKQPVVYVDPEAKHRYRELDYDGEWVEFSGDDFKTDGKNGMPIGTENRLISVDGLLEDHSNDSVRFAVDANSGGLLVLSNHAKILISRDGSVVDLGSVTDESGNTFPINDINIKWCAST